MPKKSKINVLLVGLGRIGCFYDKNNVISKASHFGAIVNSKGLKLKAICDKNTKTINKISSEYKIDQYKSIEEIDPKENFDLIVIATPDKTHYEIVKYALRLKPKVIFIEKPLSTNIKSTEEIIHLSNESKIGLMVNFSRRFNPFFKNLKTIFESQRHTPKNIIFKFTGSILHNGIHFIDLALYLLGHPDEIKVLNRNQKKDKIFQFSYLAMNAKISFLQISNIKASVEEIDIFINNNRFSIDNFGTNILDVIDDPIFEGFKLYGNNKVVPDESINSLIYAYRNLIGYINNNESLISDGKNSLSILRIIEDYL